MFKNSRLYRTFPRAKDFELPSFRFGSQEIMIAKDRALEGQSFEEICQTETDNEFWQAWGAL